ncbi:MAG: ketoacyl-ACP synthase III [Planctomycetota bacterium]
MAHSIRITAVGHALPDVVLSNDEVVERFGLEVDAAWIEERTGIRSRHWLAEGQTTSDLAVEAARAILDRRGITARDLDRILLATSSPDYPSPATATIVARKLGARCAALDFSAACAAFPYGLDLAAGAVRGGDRHVLLLCADARSRYIDKRDRRSVVLFADGAGGALLEPSEDPGLLSVALGSECLEDLGAWIPAGGAAQPISHEAIDRGEHFLHVDGMREIFTRFAAYTCEASEQALAKAGIGLGDVDLFVTHQGNANLVRAIVERLGIDPARAVNGVAEHGNTSGATIPIALSEAWSEGRVPAGSTVLFASAGAGYVFGAAVHRF